MTSIILVGVAGALATLVVAMKARAGKTRKADRWEKAEIVKRLLALSEGENTTKGILGQKSVLRTPAPRRSAATGRRAVIS